MRTGSETDAGKTTTAELGGDAARILEFLRSYADHRLNSRLIDERRCLPPSAVLEFGRAGLLGLQVPKRYGGQELSYRDTFRVMEQLAAIDPNLTLLVSVHNAIGIPPVLGFADEARKAAVLPALAGGTTLATIAASEPGAGSDVRAISTTATRLPTGEYLLNGAKSWISLGSWAGYVSVFAQLRDELNRPLGITGFLVEGGTPGFHPGEEVLTLGMKGIPQNHIAIRDLRLPPGALLGGEGGSLDVAQSAFMAGRAFVGATSLGAMKRCLQISGRYASRRTVATGTLLDNGRTQQILTDSVTATHAVETLVFHIASRLDGGQQVPSELYFACKILGSELMWRVVDRSVQLLGARGFLDTNIVGQYFRDFRLLRIFEGATEAVSVYLGSTVLKDPARFLNTLFAEFGATPAATALANWFDRVSASAGGRNTEAHSHVLANTAGEIACWAILAAAASAKARGGEATDGHAARWCLDTLEDKIHSTSHGNGALLPADVLLDRISAYQREVGDTEQTLPGEASGLDALLTRL